MSPKSLFGICIRRGIGDIMGSEHHNRNAKAIGPPEGDPIASRRIFGEPPSGASGVSWSATRSSGLMRTAAACPPRVIVTRSCVPSRRSRRAESLSLAPTAANRHDVSPAVPDGAGNLRGRTAARRHNEEIRPEHLVPGLPGKPGAHPARQIVAQGVPPRTTTWRGDHAKREVRRQLGTSVSA
jgi:hypothetical protein